MIKSKKLLAVGVIAALGLAACGSDDDCGKRVDRRAESTDDMTESTEASGGEGDGDLPRHRPRRHRRQELQRSAWQGVLDAIDAGKRPDGSFYLECDLRGPTGSRTSTRWSARAAAHRDRSASRSTRVTAGERSRPIPTSPGRSSTSTSSTSTPIRRPTSCTTTCVELDLPDRRSGVPRRLRRRLGQRDGCRRHLRRRQLPDRVDLHGRLLLGRAALQRGQGHRRPGPRLGPANPDTGLFTGDFTDLDIARCHRREPARRGRRRDHAGRRPDQPRRRRRHAGHRHGRNR